LVTDKNGDLLPNPEDKAAWTKKWGYTLDFEGCGQILPWGDIDAFYSETGKLTAFIRSPFDPKQKRDFPDWRAICGKGEQKTNFPTYVHLCRSCAIKKGFLW
jgi:hypothetical protein